MLTWRLQFPFKGCLTGDAEKCIAGMSLSVDKYTQAWGLLSDRYGNPHLVISLHRDQLLKLQHLITSNNVKDFRVLSDKIENHLRSLLVLRINWEHCGPMLLPLVLEKLPSDIR